MYNLCRLINVLILCKHYNITLCPDNQSKVKWRLARLSSNLEFVNHHMGTHYKQHLNILPGFKNLSFMVRII